ncbi:6426_t:CDS:2 [Gigaspora margarita]|uniref:6426_t:CDS:1 n=1 Tax=Gigaspora margarita TaxID=4874 RepID=A0ABN7W8G7_GIGMA|nr:6426_t:CDS:2 [Gigaspora margarita]
MDDLSTYTSSKKSSSESSDTYEHELDCMVILSPEVIYQNEECDSSFEVALSSEEVIPTTSTSVDTLLENPSNPFYDYQPKIALGTKNTFDMMLTKKKDKSFLVDFNYEDLILSEQQETSEPDEIARQSSDTAASAHTKKPEKGGGSSLHRTQHGVCIIEMPNGKPYSRVIKTSNSTTSLWRHLKNKHGYSNGELLSNKKEQMTIPETFNRLALKPHGIIEQAIRDHAVTKLIIAQNLPLSFVKGEMFKQFAKILDPRWTVPTKEKIKNLIDDGFKHICNALCNDLNQTKTVSLTANMWTAHSHDGYLCITIIWINENFELNKAVLAFIRLQYPHTANVITKSINDIFEFWGLKDKVFSITTDSGANMKLACNKLGVKWVPCSAHILNLIVQKRLLPAKHLIVRSDKAWVRILELKPYIEILSSSLTVQPEADAVADGKHLKKIMITESE